MRRAERESAFVEFATARRDQLRRIAYGMCGDWHLADDLTQATLIKLYTAWPRVARDGREEAYARKVLVNTAIDAARKPARRERPTEVLPEQATRTSLDVADRTVLVQALQTLPAQQRATILLRHWLGLSVAETASELGISEGTVKSHSSRGLTAMRVRLAVLNLD